MVCVVSNFLKKAVVSTAACISRAPSRHKQHVPYQPNACAHHHHYVLCAGFGTTRSPSTNNIYRAHRLPSSPSSAPSSPPPPSSCRRGTMWTATRRRCPSRARAERNRPASTMFLDLPVRRAVLRGAVPDNQCPRRGPAPCRTLARLEDAALVELEHRLVGLDGD